MNTAGKKYHGTLQFTAIISILGQLENLLHDNEVLLGAKRK